MTPEARDDRAARWVGAYVHVPFCARVCPYCDFAVVAGRDDLIGRYLDALVAEVAQCDGPPVDALYVGGGTPSRIGADGLGRLVDAVRSGPGLASDAEVSLEANPEDISARFATDVVAAGFDRISLGVQSLDPAVLHDLGRVHTAEEAAAAIGVVGGAGFRSINVDLIYGSPVETVDSWTSGVAAVVDQGVDHLSMYALTVEKGTALSRSVAAGAPEPDPDDQADKWEAGMDIAAGAGLVRYEVSNTARPGSECRYNLLTWAQGEFHAFGNGAHRNRGETRSWNIRRVEAYIDAIEASGAATSGSDIVSGWRREQERLMLGLRRASGVETGPGGRAFLDSEAGRRLVASGIIEEHGARLRVARPMLTDSAVRHVLALDEVDC